MQIINSISREKLNKFLIEQKQSQFLQSWEWGELAAKEGMKIVRLGVEDEDKIVAVASLVKKKIFGFSYWFCPRGPVISLKAESYKVINFLFNEIKKTTKREKIIFLRFEPRIEIQNLPAGRQGSRLEIVQSIDIEPSKTAIIDLNKTEGALLNTMHQKTRYNIRLAEKRGVTIRIADEEDFDNFWRIMKQTVKRDGFRLHDKKHYQNILSLNNNSTKLFLAEYQGRVAAAVLASFFGDMITYIHGASADKDRNVMAPYLLHWQIMKIGKIGSYKYYDLNGVDEKKWPGVTRFKMGFGGEAVSYPGTFDLVFNRKVYDVYKTLRAIRRKF